MANAMQALGEHVHQEATDELVCAECHHLVAFGTFNAIILVVEGDASGVGAEDQYYGVE